MAPHRPQRPIDRMSPSGQKLTSAQVTGMFAFPPRTNIGEADADVSFVPTAEVRALVVARLLHDACQTGAPGLGRPSPHILLASVRLHGLLDLLLDGF